MADDYTPIFTALHQATLASISANGQLIATNAQLAAVAQALITAADATRHARDEHADMRDTVDRLETLVTDLQQRLNKLEG